MRFGHPQYPDPPRPTGNTLDGACGFERVEMVLGRTDPAETEGLGDLGLRGRHALGLDALGDQGEDGLLGIGQIHG